MNELKLDSESLAKVSRKEMYQIHFGEENRCEDESPE